MDSLTVSVDFLADSYSLGLSIGSGLALYGVLALLACIVVRFFTRY